MSRRGLTPIKLAYDLRRPDGWLPAPFTDYRPVCQQSWSRSLLLCRTHHFFPSSGWSHNQYSHLPTRGGMAEAESTCVLGSVPGWFAHPLKTVTHRGTNRARRRVTTLIESNALPLRPTGNTPYYVSHCIQNLAYFNCLFSRPQLLNLFSSTDK